MRYGIVIFPSKHVQDEANALRKRYDPRYSLIPPHITLKEAFDMDEKERDKVTDELRKIAKETKPVQININKVSTFAPITNTVYFKVEQTDDLKALHEKMHKEPFPVERDYAFVPHITIAQELMEEEYYDVFGSLQLKKVSLEDTADRMQLCYQLDNGSWSVFETFVFEG